MRLAAERAKIEDMHRGADFRGERAQALQPPESAPAAIAELDAACHFHSEIQAVPAMATNTGQSSRKGAVKERVQAKNPVTGRYVKIDTNTGRIIDHKKSPGPYKGVKVVTRKK